MTSELITNLDFLVVFLEVFYALGFEHCLDSLIKHVSMGVGFYVSGFLCFALRHFVNPHFKGALQKK